MRKFFGFFVLLTGLAFGFFAFYPDAPDRESRLAEITEILAAPAGEVSRVAGETGLMRSFAPAHPVIIRAPSTAVAPSRSADARVAVAQPPTLKLTPAVVAETVAPPRAESGWKTVIATDTRAVPSHVTSPTPGDGASRYELVLDIQRELRRAGCYGGSLSGSWTANTKRAMSAFMERVNATLPIDQPDYILLTLIKGQAASCVTCPVGQSLSDGRCVPNAVIAQKKAPRTDDRKFATNAKHIDQGFTTTTAVAEADITTTASIPAPAATPLPGRMGMGGPTPEFRKAPANDVATEAWTTRVLPAPSAHIPPVAVAPPKSGAPTRDAMTNTIAALDPEEEDSLQATVPQPHVPPAAAAAPGLPGAKSGTAAYGPNDPRSGFAAPAPRPRAAPSRPRASSARPARVYRHHTRSVQQFFMHPLGRM